MQVLFFIPCLSLQEHYQKISYIARYAPDFWAALSKKNPTRYLKFIFLQFLRY